MKIIYTLHFLKLFHYDILEATANDTVAANDKVAADDTAQGNNKDAEDDLIAADDLEKNKSSKSDSG